MKFSDAASLFCALRPRRAAALRPAGHAQQSGPASRASGPKPSLSARRADRTASRRAAAFRDDRARTPRIGRTVPRFAPCASAHGTAFPEWSENFANLPGIPKVFLLLLTAAAGSLKNTGKSQGGVQVPTGGEPRFGAARGRVFKGKAQIRCKSGADGNSPEERERIFRLSLLKHSPLS